jgi:hypothetical protein
MSNPTTPFSWQMPTATDLVTDLPADFEVFGQAVATSMADLLGGASGYILSKASATDMDFTWIANDQGDITGITATTPLTGGGSSGAITVGIQDALTTQKGAVQLSDSTSTTSSILAATPTAVKSAYDLAAAAIPKSTVTTNGDVIYATGSSAVTRLGIGSAGQVLTVAAGVPSWATAAGGGMTSIASGSLSGSSLALISIVGTYKNLVLVLRNYTTGTDFDLNCKINSLVTAGDYSYNLWESATTNGSAAASATYYNSTVFGLNNSLIDNTDGDNSLVLTVNDYADTTANKIMTGFQSYKRSTGQKTVLQSFGSVNTTAAVTAITLTPSAGTWTAGTYTLYGVN